MVLRSSLPFLFLLFGYSEACLATIGPDSYGDGSVVCPTGWVLNVANSYCYYFNQASLTFDDAQAFCQSLATGAQLASITNRNENSFIFNQLYPATGTPPVYYYLGATTATGAKDFHWLDGSAFGFNAFASGEPDNGGGMDNCLVMQIPVTAIFPNPDLATWYDRYCPMVERSVCKVAGTYIG